MSATKRVGKEHIWIWACWFPRKRHKSSGMHRHPMAIQGQETNHSRDACGAAPSSVGGRLHAQLPLCSLSHRTVEVAWIRVMPLVLQSRGWMGLIWLEHEGPVKVTVGFLAWLQCRDKNKGRSRFGGGYELNCVPPTQIHMLKTSLPV